jgi:hypothetical protein
MRKLLFSLVLLAVAAGGIEAASWLLLRGVGPPELETRLRALAILRDPEEPGRRVTPVGRGALGGGFWEEVIHPYLGYVTLPPAEARAEPTLEALGFPSRAPLVRERSPDTVVMAVFGGSVAQYFAGQGAEHLFAELASLPGFGGRRLVVLGAAQAGYKQPQSLIALAYLLALGVHLDLVVLLDGFNEVVGPKLGSDAEVFPLYPNRWLQRVADLDVATEVRSLIGEIAYHKEQRARWADWLVRSRLRHSHVVAVLWAVYDRRVETLLAARRLALADRRAGQKLDYLATGPRFADGSVPYEELVRVWSEGSIGMHALAQVHGIRFFHFLQPNQHLPGSKPMGEAERERAVAGGERYAPHVRGGYPLLREAGAALRERGVWFHDLTPVFGAVEEPIYVDNCCHFGQRGNELVAEAMAARIRAEPEGEPEASESPRGPGIGRAARGGGSGRGPPAGDPGREPGGG